jgi:hypothetical protein
MAPALVDFFGPTGGDGVGDVLVVGPVVEEEVVYDVLVDAGAAVRNTCQLCEDTSVAEPVRTRVCVCCIHIEPVLLNYYA